MTEYFIDSMSAICYLIIDVKDEQNAKEYVSDWCMHCLPPEVNKPDIEEHMMTLWHLHKDKVNRK